MRALSAASSGGAVSSVSSRRTMNCPIVVSEARRQCIWLLLLTATIYTLVQQLHYPTPQHSQLNSQQQQQQQLSHSTLLTPFEQSAFNNEATFISQQQDLSPYATSPFALQLVSALTYASPPIIWKLGGNLTALTSGNALMTITGDYWQQTGDCVPDVVVTFTWDYSDGRTALCPVQSFTYNTIICRVPAGVGVPQVSVRSCGFDSSDMPVFPQDFIFWPNSTLPYNVNWCAAMPKQSGTSEATLWTDNYLCSRDTKAKKEYDSLSSRKGNPLFLYSTSSTAPANDNLPNSGGAYTAKNNLYCVSVTGLMNDGVTQQAGWSVAGSYNSRLCLPVVSNYDNMFWSTIGAVPGKACLPFIEPQSALTFWTSGSAQLCMDQKSPYLNDDLVLRYHYDAPKITSIPAGSQNGPTTGGTTITLYGTSFGNITYSTVTIGGVNCPVTFGTYTQLQCTLPPGSGQNLLIYVFVDGVTSVTPWLFAYDPPVIYVISPSTVPTQGGRTITIQGLNFGTNQPSVSANGLDCAIDPNVNIFNNTYITCTSPPGQGLNIPVVVTASFRTNSPYTSFGYDRPTIYGITPQPFETVGSTLLTVNGTSMGTTGTITIGGQTCTLSGAGWSHQQIQCILPAGQGVNNPVVVTVSGQTNLATGYSYAAPVISGITWSGLSVTIIGTSFGTSGTVLLSNAVCTQTSYSARRIVYTAPAGQGLGKPTNVTVSGQTSNTVFFSYPPVLNTANTVAAPHPTSGGVAFTVTGVGFGLPAVSNITINVGAALCTPVTSQTDTTAQCLLPAGQGQVQVYVTAFGQQSNQITFTYDPPTLASINPTSGPTAGGTLLTLVGTNFGTNPAVTVNNQPAIFVTGNSTVVFARTPAGSGATNQVKITTNAASTSSYNYAYNAPTLSSVFPTHGPSQGGYTVILTGTNFATFPAIVTVSGVTTSPDFQNDTYIAYTSPQGAGNVNIFLIVNGQASTNSQPFIYDGANVTSVVPSAGPTAGGISVTIRGTSFGTSGYASFGGVQAASLFYNSTYIIATLPVGMGSAPVTVTSGSTAGNSFAWAYNRPVISLVNPASAQTRGGTLISLTGTDFGQSGVVTIGGQVCTTTQTGTQYGDTSVICSLAPGQGANLPVVINVGAQVPVVTPVFSYLPPQIFSIVPSSGVTQGGNSITISGQNFGILAQINFGTPTGPLCTPVGLGQSHTIIQCTVPAGQGLNVPVYVNVTNQTVSTLYNYQAPVINTIVPLFGPTAGAIPITLNGINFGLQTVYSLLFNGVSQTGAAITSFSHTQIVFTLPRGTGANVPIGLSVSSQVATYSGQLFSYNAPSVSTASGCPTTIGSTTTNCDITGGTILTLTGANFGNDSSQVSVQIGSNACTKANVTIVDSQIKCFVPANANGGFNLNVNVTVNGLTGGAPLLSYAGPVIRASTLGNSTGYTTGSSLYQLITDPSGTVGTGGDVTFKGYFFGTTTVTITYGPPGQSNLYSCPTVVTPSNTLVTQLDGNSTVSCTLQPGAGTGLVFVLKTGALTSAEGSDRLNYPLPVIVPNSIRDTLNNAKTNSMTGTSTEGDAVFFDVLHVGTDPSQVTVYYGPVGAVNTLCLSVTLPKDQNNVQSLRCLTQPGSGSNLVFQLRAVNALSAVGTDKYNYVTAPQITKVSGCTDVGNTTTQCPTVGGTTITVTGTDFGQSGLSVRVGSDSCVNVVFLNAQQLTCQLVASAGLLKPVTVIVGALYSRPQTYVSYSQATISSISGCTDAFGSTTNCPRAGGTIVTIQGSNFGPPSAIVLVGNALCANVTQASDSQLTCTIASGTQSNRAVLLIQNGGALTVGSVYLSYTQCAVGTFALDGVIPCAACAQGSVRLPQPNPRN